MTGNYIQLGLEQNEAAVALVLTIENGNFILVKIFILPLCSNCLRLPDISLYIEFCAQ